MKKNVNTTIELPCTQYGYKADPAKMPNEKPAWEMTAQEFADNPPSREWFNWFGWPEGHHYCNYSRRYALQTGYPCCIKKAIRDGHISSTPIGAFVNSPEVVYTCDDCSYNMSCRATAQEVEQCHADQNSVLWAQGERICSAYGQ